MIRKVAHSTFVLANESDRCFFNTHMQSSYFTSTSSETTMKSETLDMADTTLLLGSEKLGSNSSDTDTHFEMDNPPPEADQAYPIPTSLTIPLMMSSMLPLFEDDSYTDGYLADTEGDCHRFGSSSFVRNPQSSSRGRRASCSSTERRLQHGGTKNNLWCTRGLQHRTTQRKKRKCSDDRRWIQRVYSNTPFNLALVHDIEALDDVSRIGGAGPESSMINHMWPKPIISRPIMKSLNGLHLPRSYENQENVIASFSDLSCCHNATSRQKKGTVLDDEYSALLNIVSALLKECHDSQAQYRTYSPNSGDDQRIVS